MQKSKNPNLVVPAVGIRCGVHQGTINGHLKVQMVSHGGGVAATMQTPMVSQLLPLQQLGSRSYDWLGVEAFQLNIT